MTCGMPIELACESAGISKPTFYRWVHDGAKADAKPYEKEFSYAVKKAQRDFILSSMQEIKRQGPRNWTAIAWTLERTRPAFFGRESLKMELAEISRQIAEINKAMAANGQPGRIKDMLGAGGLNEDEGGE